MRNLFFILDTIVFFLITAGILALRGKDGGSISFFLSNCKVMIPVFIINTIILFIFSFYDLKATYKKSINYYSELISAFLLSFLISSAGIYFGLNLFSIPTPKTNLILVLLIYFLYIFFTRKIYSLLHLSTTNIIIIGKTRTLDKIRTAISKKRQYKIIYDFTSLEEIPENLETKNLNLAIIENSIIENKKTNFSLIINKFISKKISIFDDFYFFEHLFERLSHEIIENPDLIIKYIINQQKRSLYPTIKRYIDILISLILLPVCLPLGIMIYILILLIDRQNPFFFQERLGANGNIINICKFKTMIENTEQPTKLGKILRKFRLDEIPQLINILDGDISFIGPRPLYINDNTILNKNIYSNSLRTLVKPGLTGWAQLNFKAPFNYSSKAVPTFQSIQEKNKYFKAAITRLAYDMWYIKNYSFSLDVEIFLKTIKRMFVKDQNLN